MRGLLLVACASLIVASPAARISATAPGSAAQAGQAARPVPAPDVQRGDALPVRRVVLYKNGVGYFEHIGRVRGSQSVTIDFTSGQLNDALKSLTTLDLGNGRITGISYNSEAPVSERLSALGLPIGDASTVSEFFGALRGTRLEARTAAGVVTGRLLAVQTRTRTSGEKETSQVDELSIVTDAGEVRLIELTPSVSVRLADPDLTSRVGRYLGVLASAQQQSLRRMTIATAGSGERQLFVSYVSEVPVWKTTYRLVLPSKPGAKPLLQGWAIVDNTVGEDWTGVELSLVAGAPQSFIQQISQPYYVRRPVVPLPSSALLTPQTHEAGMPAEAPAAPPPPAAPAPAKRMDLVPRAAGGAAGGVVGGVHESVTVTGESPIVDAIAALEPAASGRELGDLFEYRIKEPVTIRKNQSAMVPIANAEVGIEKVTIWSPGGANAVPLRAIWLDNTTGLTLDGGSFTVLESEAFAGEGLTEALKPGEKRLLSYAADTAVHVAAKTDGGARRVERIVINKGTLVQTVQDQEHRVYTVRNDDVTPRTVIVEHPARPGWRLAPSTPKPAESTPAVHRFRLPVDSKKTVTLTVDEVHPLEMRYVISRMTGDDITLFLRGPGINPAVQAALEPIVGKKQAIAAVDRDLAARKAETDRIGSDQERIRENMKALKGSAEEKALVARYVRQLDEQENRLETLRRETSALEQQRSKLQTELDALIAALTLEA